MSQHLDATSAGVRQEHHRRTLFQHTPHPHQPINVNLIFEAEKACGNFNQRVAVWMTEVFQAMPTFWLIMAWIVLWIVPLHPPQYRKNQQHLQARANKRLSLLCLS
ncbi:MAG TPA: hypothetical protein VKR06_05265 [Ktedonosporobacter sp.]|nr:hypothetical protein [Ktedonosporobacter sp.]